MITETIFENRFMHVPELARMGARINVHGGSALVRGVQGAHGRAGDGDRPAAPRSRSCWPALAAKGQTEINRIYHLDRGYERLEEKLGAVGARIERVAVTRDEGRWATSCGSRRPTAEDLAVIAAFLQDARIPLREMVYSRRSERRFMAAFTRYRREQQADPGRPARA